MQSNNLSPGFIEVEKACELIKSDNRENPVVDMDYLTTHTVWIETNHNFRIPKIRRLAPDQVIKTRRGKVIEYENTGDVYVYIATNYEKELLKKTILEKFKELVGHEYKEAGVKARSTVADDAEGRTAVRPRNSSKPIAKEGETITEGMTMTTNGENISL